MNKNIWIIILAYSILNKSSIQETDLIIFM